MKLVFIMFREKYTDFCRCSITKISKNLVDVYSNVPVSDMNSSDVAYVKKMLATSEHYKKIMLERASNAKTRMHVANMDAAY